MVLTMIRKTKQSFYRTIFNKKKLNEQFQERTKNSNFVVNIFLSIKFFENEIRYKQQVEILNVYFPLNLLNS